MSEICRLHLRTAERVRDQLLSLRSSRPVPKLPEDDWDRSSTLARQFQKAQSRGWQLAAAIIRGRYQGMFRQLVENLRDEEHRCLSAERPRTLLALRQISDDLAFLEREYDVVRIDSDRCTLTVMTERIILEGIDLGPFEIRLRWDRIGQRRPYETVALQPNPARGDEDVTHPHVQSGALCEGEGHVAIDRALREGRLCDFFAIVDRVLHTYSPASPYVPLEQWTGVTCTDCGSVADEEEATSCTRCGDNLCLDCRTYCEHCECDFCNGCIGSCRACDAAICSTCQVHCAHCGKRCCSGCLTDREFCEECQNEQDRESENSSEETLARDPTALPATPGAATEASPVPGAPF